MNRNLEITQHLGLVTDEINDSGEFRVISEDFGNQNIFLDFVMPKEKVLFERLKYKRSSYFNLLKVIETPNSNRTDPICPHFTVCGGCSFQHMDHNFYKEHKLRKLSAALFDYKEKILDLIIVPHGLRRKANFEGIKKDDKVFLGFHRHNSRQIINIQTCKIIRKEIVNLLEPLKALLSEILENFQKAEFFIVLVENGLDLGLEIQGVRQFPHAKRFLVEEFSKSNNLNRFIFRHGNKFDTLYQNELEKLPYLKFSNFEVPINPWAFMQTSKEAESIMLSVIQNIIDKIDIKDKALDLFSGRGTYSLSLIHNFQYLKAIELSGEAISTLKHVAKTYELNIETEERDLFVNPVTSMELNCFESVIINPPRAGAEKQSIEINNSDVKNLIYVSCNPETFARDLKILSQSYKINLIQPIDQFIWSNHLELIVWLDKK